MMFVKRKNTSQELLIGRKNICGMSFEPSTCELNPCNASFQNEHDYASSLLFVHYASLFIFVLLYKVLLSHPSQDSFRSGKKTTPISNGWNFQDRSIYWSTFWRGRIDWLGSRTGSQLYQVDSIARAFLESIFYFSQHFVWYLFVIFVFFSPFIHPPQSNEYNHRSWGSRFDCVDRRFDHRKQHHQQCNNLLERNGICNGNQRVQVSNYSLPLTAPSKELGFREYNWFNISLGMINDVLHFESPPSIIMNYFSSLPLIQSAIPQTRWAAVFGNHDDLSKGTGGTREDLMMVIIIIQLSNWYLSH